MAEKGNPKPQPGKGQPSTRRRTQVAVPHARLAREVTAPARDPGTVQRPPPAPAAPSAPVRSRVPPASTQSTRVPSAQDTPGPSRARPGDHEEDPEPAQRRVRVARLTEAALRQLGGISSCQRILQWLDSTFGKAGAMAQLPEELRQELDGFWEAEEHGNSSGGKGL